MNAIERLRAAYFADEDFIHTFPDAVAAVDALYQAVRSVLDVERVAIAQRSVESGAPYEPVHIEITAQDLVSLAAAVRRVNGVANAHQDRLNTA